MTISKPGVFEGPAARTVVEKDKMVLLLAGYDVYMYEYQRDLAITKANAITKRSKTNTPNGTQCARYLMDVFFTSEDMLTGTLNPNGKDGLKVLNQHIKLAILNFTLSLNKNFCSNVISTAMCNCCTGRRNQQRRSQKKAAATN